MTNADPTQKSAATTGACLWLEIRLKESLEPHWQEWFGDLALDTLAPGQAHLSGTIRDQAELHGILERIRDLNLQIISLQVQDLPCEKEAGWKQKE